MSGLALIPLAQISTGHNCRTALTDIDELAASIQEIGLLEPLVVRPAGDGYQVVCGYRRLAACRLIRLTEVPCHVREMDDRQEILANLAENETRRPVNPIDVGLTVKRMVDEHGYTQYEIAERLCKSQTWVSNHLRILELPRELQRRIANFDIGVQTALRPFRQRRSVALSGFEDNNDTIDSVNIQMSRSTHRAARLQAKRNRTHFHGFVEEQLMLGIDWKALGLPNPFDKVKPLKLACERSRCREHVRFYDPISERQLVFEVFVR